MELHVAERTEIEVHFLVALDQILRMVRSTIIARTTDGECVVDAYECSAEEIALRQLSRWPLRMMTMNRFLAPPSPCWTAETDGDGVQDQVKLPEYKQQAKLIFRRVTPQSEPRCSIESGACTLQSVVPLGALRGC